MPCAYGEPHETKNGCVVCVVCDAGIGSCWCSSCLTSSDESPLRDVKIRPDCFQAVVDVARAICDDDDANGDEHRAVIVHGTPVSRHPEHRGDRYWHAWVEIPDVDVVLDYSHGNQLAIDRSAFYALGGLNASHDELLTWRFTWDEAQQQMRDRDHYGPWVDDYDGVTSL